MNRKQFILIIAIWLAGIFGLIGYKQLTIATGTTVLLETVPVDPRDVFRGDYVTLNYVISDYDSIPFEDNAIEPYVQSGDTIYVVLRLENGIGVPQYKTLTRPDSQLYIKGRVTGYESDYTSYSIEYGIESYFVPEGKGRDIERMRGRNLYAQVSVDKNGNAVITDISFQ
ncbi:MAG: GDYXXLXY domain-containing protein [Candidatus Roizmanbacteria bacterium]|nr:GDYXXLXY domain-containing protein [Candidatus Roizmanbacteria bacterium]